MTSKERKQRYLLKKKIAKYGAEMADVDMRGRHGNHARGDRSGRWCAGKLVTSHGYVAVRVEVGHPHGWGGGQLRRYAYEHHVVVMALLGRPLTADECVHHVDGNKQNNDPSNLLVTTVREHAHHHYRERGVDGLGRFPKMAENPGEAERREPEEAP